MRVDSFDFDLPSDRIATRPVEPRDAARLLHVDGSGGRTHHIFADLPRLLEPGDILVVNDTRVVPVRMSGTSARTPVEVTAVGCEGGSLWRVLARPARKLKRGQHISLPGEISAAVVAREANGAVILDVGMAREEFLAHLECHGSMPLPPYIRRRADGRDHSDYQTIFALNAGAIAAPTAGLHFTERLLEALAATGIGRVALTLHVGPGTFMPVRTDAVRDHDMQGEWGEISPEAAARINAARQSGRRIIAVGTTTVRLLESAVDDSGVVHPYRGDTTLFITPGHRFRAIDALITNFHLPRSTLFMLVCAFLGTGIMKRAYQDAIAGDYRFYSYGDACLLSRERPC
ncbi:MAG: tRNA preQ1(34) S-adenosylmethionine ribosyltransferase-isomerase QueA [bacterium]|nr:tRNA preQ1(34) S-adenosylmethionine ribosyltransferase-isomerase QueA [bacterium]